MKAQSNIAPDKIQNLGNGTSYVNFNISEENGVFAYESLLVVGEVTLEKVVVAFIREKYSQDDEFSLSSKSMQLYFNNCTEEQKGRWVSEIKVFTDYRMQCIEKAKEICNGTI